MKKNDTYNLYRSVKEIVGPMRKALTTIEGKDGQQLNIQREQLNTWKEYFSGVFNQPTHLTNLDSFQLELNPGESPSDDPQSRADIIITTILCQLKNKKSPGEDGITSKLLKGGEDVTNDLLFELFNQIWEQQ